MICAHSSSDWIAGADRDQAFMTLTLNPSQHWAALLGRRTLQGLLVLKLRKLRAASTILPARAAWDWLLHDS